MQRHAAGSATAWIQADKSRDGAENKAADRTRGRALSRHLKLFGEEISA